MCSIRRIGLLLLLLGVLLSSRVASAYWLAHVATRLPVATVAANASSGASTPNTTTQGHRIDEVRHRDDTNQRTLPAQIADKTADSEVKYQRDVLGRLTKTQLIVPGTGEVTENILERDEHGRVLSESQQGRKVSYVCDAYGRAIERLLPTGSRTRYAYNASGELKHLELDGYLLDFEHDVAGRETARKTRAGLSLEHNYDALDRLIERKVAVDPSATLQALGSPSAARLASQRRWQYDANGRVTQLDDALWGSTTYRYDPAGRLLEAKSHQLHELFSHDLTDNITGFIAQLNPNQGGVATEERAVHGNGGRLLRKGNTDYHYDRKGRRIGKVRTLSDGTQQGTSNDWDTRDKLRKLTRSSGFTIVYEYDAFGRRIKKTKYDPQRTAPVTTLYTWDGEVLAAELDTEQGPRNFVHAPGSFEPMLQQQNGEVFLCVNDHLGMPKDLVAGDGAVAWSATHSAYGRVVATYADDTARARYGTAINSPFQLLGQVADEDAELCFTRYRCFDPEIGAWISSDPLELEGGLNLYGFDGAPTDVVDPLGLSVKNKAHHHEEEIPDDAIVVRNGECKPGSFATGSGVKSDGEGKLSEISTSSKGGASVEELSRTTPNGKVGVTTAGEIRKAGGTVTPDPSRDNPNHAVVSGITDEKATELFRVQENPIPKKERPKR